MKHYTYIHKRADDGRVFYVGLGSTKGRYKSSRGRNPYWHRVVAKHGFTAEIVCRWGTREEAASHEILLIECFRDMGYELTNMTNGGDGSWGIKHSAETRGRISQAHSTPESRAKKSELMKQRMADPEERIKVGAILGAASKKYFADHENRALASAREKQRTADPEVRARLSEQTRRQMADPEARARLSAQMKQHCADPEARARLSEQTRRQMADPEARARLSAQMKQHCADPEVRARLSEQTRRQMSSPEVRAQLSERMKGRIVVNNGQISKRVWPDQIPEGFVRGFIKAAKPVSVSQ